MLYNRCSDDPFRSVRIFDAPAIIGTSIPLVIFLIPIVAILTKHQQRMAEIIHGNNRPNELADLRQEVAELRSLVQRQNYAIDQLQGLTPRSSASDVDLSMRLRSDQI